jgi:hypothetical protein|tara:strand:+ start:231 stop:350 length:120 start_codon:yes stop_codon:yes gene_type:complete
MCSEGRHAQPAAEQAKSTIQAMFFLLIQINALGGLTGLG